MNVTDRQLAQWLFDGREDEVVEFLARRHQFSRFHRVARAFSALWKRTHGLSDVRIETPMVLSESVQTQIQKSCDGATVTFVVEPSLISGARLRLDDRRFDASASGSLERLFISV